MSTMPRKYYFGGCACGYTAYTIEQFNRHITPDSSVSHKWISVPDIIVTQPLRGKSAHVGILRDKDGNSKRCSSNRP